MQYLIQFQSRTILYPALQILFTFFIISLSRSREDVKIKWKLPSPSSLQERVAGKLSHACRACVRGSAYLRRAQTPRFAAADDLARTRGRATDEKPPSLRRHSTRSFPERKTECRADGRTDRDGDGWTELPMGFLPSSLQSMPLSEANGRTDGRGRR